MDSFYHGFRDELHKVAFNMGAALRAGGPSLAAGAALAGVAIYDLIRGKSKGGISADEVKGISSGKQVGSRRWVQKLLKDQPLEKKTMPVTTGRDIDIMVKDPAFNALQRSLLKAFAKGVIEKGTNAAVVQGKEKDYVIVPPKANAAVVEHEVGHLRDFATEEYSEPGLLSRLISTVWKPTYEKTTLGPERRAWKYVKTKRGTLPARAIGTYESAFHKGRALSAGAVGAATIARALEQVLKAGKAAGVSG